MKNVLAYYNASAVKIYNATSSLGSAFWKQKYFILPWKTFNE
jgi:hypothetical protein